MPHREGSVQCFCFSTCMGSAPSPNSGQFQVITFVDQSFFFLSEVNKQTPLGLILKTLRTNRSSMYAFTCTQVSLDPK